MRLPQEKAHPPRGGAAKPTGPHSLHDDVQPSGRPGCPGKYAPGFRGSRTKAPPDNRKVTQPMIAITKFAGRRRDSEEGFTLIELMVVVLIIAILIAIAIPTFLGARSRAQDRAAQSSLRNGVIAAKTLYTDAQDYTTATPAALLAVEPSLTYVAAATVSTGASNMSVATTTTTVIMAALSKSGTCFWMKDDVGASGGTTFAKAATTCSAALAPGAFLASW